MRARWFIPVALLAALAAAACGGDESGQDNGGTFGGDAGGSGGAGSTAGNTATSGAANGAGGAAGGMAPDDAASSKSEISKSGGGKDIAGCAQVPTKQTSVTLTVANPRWLRSAPLARASLNAGQAPDPTAVDPIQLLGYYTPSYDPPAAGAPLAVVPELRLDGSGDLTLQIGVRAPDAPAPREKVLALTLLVDTSPSMAGDSMARAKAAAKTIAAHLQLHDTVTLVATSPEIEDQTFKIQGPSDGPLIQAINDLAPGGDGTLDRALEQAYTEADAHFVKDGDNRLAFLTDAGTPASAVNLTPVSDHAASGISLIGLGVGPADGYRSGLLDAMSLAGAGAHLYLDDFDAAEVAGSGHHSILAARFAEVFDVAARAVKVTIIPPWYYAVRDPQGQPYGDADATVNDTSDLTVGHAMVFRQVLHPCDASVILDDDDDFSVEVDYQTPDGVAATPVTMTFKASQVLVDSARIAKADAVSAYAAALASQNPDHLRAALSLATAPPLDTDADMIEIGKLIQLHPAYAKQ